MSVDLECNFHCSQFRLNHVKLFLKAVNRNHLMLHFLYTMFLSQFLKFWCLLWRKPTLSPETKKATMGGNDLENETIDLRLGHCE